jgi:hypothetical protein
MSQRVRVLKVDAVTARDPKARCATCGRVGTWAWIARGQAPRTVDRYCRGCWRVAHERSEAAVWGAIAAYEQAHSDWVARWQGGARTVMPEVPDLGNRVMGWHWSLILGSWWRSLRREIPFFFAHRRSAT